jgi:hypothetical protein
MLYIIFLVIKPVGIKKATQIPQIKVMPQKWNTKLRSVKINTELHSTSNESECM